MLPLLIAALSPNVQSGPAWIAPWVLKQTKAPRWIWAQGRGGQPPTAQRTDVDTALFERKIQLDGKARVRLAFAADNSASIQWDGWDVLHSDSYSTVAVTEFDADAGLHTIQIIASNGVGTGANPAGLIGTVDVTYSNGDSFRIVTDAKWIKQDLSHTLVDKINPLTDFATDLGPCDMAPWGLSPSMFQESHPCPMLRRSFVLDAIPKAATVRVIGLGHYELTLNGKRVGKTVIDQAWSQYDKRLYWQEFDLLPYLKEGENVFGVLLGNSFYRVEKPNNADRYAKPDAMPDFSDGRPFLLWLDAQMTMGDGSTLAVQSDDLWKWHDSPLTFSNVYGGEDWDARLEEKGWDEQGFDDGAWSDVKVVDAPSAKTSQLPFIGLEEFERFQPVKVEQPEADIVTYVFPQNCSELLDFTVEGPRGATIRLLPCEYLDPTTNRVKFTYTSGTGTDIYHDYTLKGGGEEHHQIKFCYVGAQYVEIRGAVPEGAPNPNGRPVVKKIEMVHTRAANKLVGQFHCSSDLQNRAFHMIDWSIRSNMSYVPTDCPHREKTGWQEEIWDMARAISYRFDIRDWYRKVAQDIRDTQLPDGHVPTNVPNVLVGLGPHGFWNEAPEWGVSSVLVPWHLYEWYGDKETLAKSYTSMKRYVDYLTSIEQDGLVDSNLGDWYDYGHGKGDGPSQWTPRTVSGTAVWALGAKTVAQAAEALGNDLDAARFWSLYSQIRESFIAHFWDAKSMQIRNNGSCQAGNCVALCVGLIPEQDREGALQSVIDDLQNRGWQQTVGEVLQVFFVRALGDAGRSDILHKVYARTDRGSYGFMVNQGLTTLPESWDAKPGTGNSMNHFMLGHLMEWHFAYVAGIRQAKDSVGWKHIRIEPFPGPLRSAESSFDSPHGKIAVSWTSAEGRFSMTVQIPEGTDATVYLPDGTHVAQGPGIRKYSCAYTPPPL